VEAKLTGATPAHLVPVIFYMCPPVTYAKGDTSLADFGQTDVPISTCWVKMLKPVVHV